MQSTCVDTGAAGTESHISQHIASSLFETIDGAELAIKRQAVNQAQQIFTELRQGTLNRDLFSANGKRYFTDQVIADFCSSLKSLEKPTQFKQMKQGIRGGMTFRSYHISCGVQTLKLTIRTLADGQIEQYQIEGNF